MTESEQQSVTEDQGLIMERVFNAPRELVWRAWTEPERFASWYGPQGFTVPTCEMDFRVGGSYSLVMRSPDGWEMRNTGCSRRSCRWSGSSRRCRQTYTMKRSSRSNWKMSATAEPR